jgi:hypothetical protein
MISQTVQASRLHYGQGCLHGVLFSVGTTTVVFSGIHDHVDPFSVSLTMTIGMSKL